MITAGKQFKKPLRALRLCASYQVSYAKTHNFEHSPKTAKMPAKTYLDVAENAGQEFYRKYHDQGAIVMLNLLRFRDTADYAASPELAPEASITGEEAYHSYLKHTTPFLQEAGGELLYAGKGGSFLIGPASEGWDMVLLVKHRSADAFIAFARNEGYLKGIGHRTAALADSRLLPLR